MLRLRDWALCSLGLCPRAVLGGSTILNGPMMKGTVLSPKGFNECVPALNGHFPDMH